MVWRAGPNVRSLTPRHLPPPPTPLGCMCLIVSLELTVLMSPTIQVHKIRVFCPCFSSRFLIGFVFNVGYFGVIKPFNIFVRVLMNLRPTFQRHLRIFYLTTLSSIIILKLRVCIIRMRIVNDNVVVNRIVNRCCCWI